MTNFHFIDRNGVHWMVIGGLPDAHPAAHVSDGAGPFTGLTFRASSGELRVLTADAMRQLAGSDVMAAQAATAPRRGAVGANWERLLTRATPWPLA